MRIRSITAQEVINSRGWPAVEACVMLENGAMGCASVPSGASTGTHEAHELLDGGARLYGRGVTKAIANIKGEIADVLRGMDASDQRAIDEKMCVLDGTTNLSRIGANAALAVSLACARAAANAAGLELYEYLGGANRMPLPMMNVINGGAHAANNVDIQEFMFVPVGAKSASEGIFMCAEAYHSLRRLLIEKGLSVSVGDEGGFAPDIEDDEQALELMETALMRASLTPGRDIAFALDVAASAWLTPDGDYLMPKRKKQLSRESMMGFISALAGRHPIISVEDPLHEEDFGGFTELRRRLHGVQVVGDDLFVTSKQRVERGSKMGSATALLVKPNQAGTLTRALDAANTAKSAGMELVVSHRSGETNDTAIADIAAALGAGFIKAGAPARGERTAKYNRIMEIERKLQKNSMRYV